MLAPLAVQDIEQNVAFQLPHGSSAGDRVDVGFPLGVSVLGIFDEDFEQLLAGELAGFSDGVGVDQVVMVHADRVQRAQCTPQLLEIPVLGVPLGGGSVDVGGDDVGEHVPGLLLEVLALQDAAALVIDDHALLIHHLVVLEHVLADLEVLLFDLSLRALDGAGDHLGLDRHVVGQVQPGQQRLQSGAVEAPHEFVAEGQIEPRLARIALPAGATAQLIVDPARLVPLGAQDVETADVADGFGLLGYLGLDLRQLLEPGDVEFIRGLNRVQPG